MTLQWYDIILRFFFILSLTGGINGPYTADVTDNFRSSNVPGAGSSHMHLRSTMGRHLNSDYAVDNNVSSLLI